MLTRILTWTAYLWCAILFLQNVGIATGAMQAGPSAGGDELGGMAMSLLVWAAARMLAISIAVLAFARHKSTATLVALAATIVLAFPLSIYLEKAFYPGHEASPGVALSVSALCSYAAALLLLYANRALMQSGRATAAPR